MKKYLICFSLFTYCSAHISEEYKFEAQFRALFLKPGSSNLHYAVQTFPVPAVSPQWNVYNLISHYHFDFDIGLSAISHESGVKFSANWERANSHTEDKRHVPAQDMISPFAESGPDAATVKEAAGGVKYSYNALHITVGQTIEYNDCLEIIPFVGIEFASIKQCLHSFFATDTHESTSINTPTSFKGAGVECGFEFSYQLCNHLSLRGYMGAAMLAGNIHNCTTYATITPLLEQANAPSPNIQTIHTDKNLITTPHLRERLAVGYDRPFWDECYSALFEVGWEAQWYGSVFQSVDLASQIINPPATGVYPRTFQKNISNFSLFGPYIAVTVDF